MSFVRTSSFTSTHCATFISDRLRVLLKVLVSHYGLDPERLVDAWHNWVDRASRTWLDSGHLRTIIIEFYVSGSDIASARWDFPISYSGSGYEELWDDRQFFATHFAKASPPPANCSYRIVLTVAPGAPDIPGVGDATLRSVTGMTIHEAGTVVATPHLTAGAKYYRK